MKDDKNVKGIETISDLTNVHLSSIKRPDHKHISDDEKLTACCLGPPSSSCHGESEGERSQGLHSPNGLLEEFLDREAKQQREETFADFDEYRLRKREDPSPMTVWVSPSADVTTRDASVQHIFPRLTETRVPVKKTVTFSTVSTSHEAPASVEQMALPPGMMAQARQCRPCTSRKDYECQIALDVQSTTSLAAALVGSHTPLHTGLIGTASFHRTATRGQQPSGTQSSTGGRDLTLPRGPRKSGFTPLPFPESLLKPFLKGELLKERLEDVQTLISQDHE
ncbi:uncharacterized protein LOC112567291 [Pomacea canaliculata]|uniref:uncharacterized protein LOC112567291 n=1 Tax=Pomacea canaliculata TaxID=400727 RepID=UPI000D72787A|nr:uncharacterized protein LOC112567291 [Pomacea canaliculata]